jgi:hypothetical protein
LIDLRLYRPALLAALLAAVVTMFSLESVPRPLFSPLAPDAFDGERAAALTRQLARNSPDPRPGSESDAELAEAVATRFTAIEGAEVSEQEYEGSFGGEDVDLRNVIAVLPGQSDRQIAVIAARDTARGSGAVSGTAATAALAEIATGFGGSTHENTLVFVSTDGGSIGGQGVRRFAEDYSEVGLVEAVVVISQPAAATPRRPLLVPWSTDDKSTAAQLAETGAAAIEGEGGLPAGGEGAVGQLLRLAIPAGLGEQAPLIERGIDAIRISSSGERPLGPEEDTLEAVSAETLGATGRAALGTLLALDASSAIEHGPGTYIEVAGNLLPGWTLSLLALALILPVAITGLDGFVRAVRRRPRAATRGLAWVVGRALPFLGALVLLRLLALVTLVPSPDFPYDPGRFGVSVWSAVAVLLLAGLVATGLLAGGALRAPPPSIAEGVPPAAVLVGSAAVLGVWLANPYLALLLAPALHLWMLTQVPTGGMRLGPTAALIAAGLLPLLLAVVELAQRFEVGLAVIWQLVLLVADGQIELWISFLGCLLAGCAVALLASRQIRPASPPEIRVRRPPPQERREPELSEESWPGFAQPSERRWS